MDASKDPLQRLRDALYAEARREYEALMDSPPGTASGTSREQARSDFLARVALSVSGSPARKES